jgi:adenosylhomocysteine nucleosidase
LYPYEQVVTDKNRTGEPAGMSAGIIGIIMATRVEAEPFIDGFGLAPAGTVPVRMYAAGPVVLAVSGIGKTAAAIATTALIERYHPSAIFNCGAAGAASGEHPPGEVFQIDRIVEPDRPRLMDGDPIIHTPDIRPGFAAASLATRDRPVINDEDRAATARLADLVDMEGAAVTQVCRAYLTPVYLFKIVTDIAGHSIDEIKGNILLYRTRLYDHFSEQVFRHFNTD